jgi:hypothetical protein
MQPVKKRHICNPGKKPIIELKYNIGDRIDLEEKMIFSKIEDFGFALKF